MGESFESILIAAVCAMQQDGQKAGEAKGRNVGTIQYPPAFSLRSLVSQKLQSHNKTIVSLYRSFETHLRKLIPLVGQIAWHLRVHNNKTGASASVRSFQEAASTER